MKKDANVLIVDDDQDILIAGKLLLKRKFTIVDICNRPEQLPDLLAKKRFDAVLLDMNFGPGESSGEQGFYWLEKIRSISPSTIVIMITAHGGVDIAVDAIKKGATDFISKPWHNEKVIATVSTAIELKQSREEAQHLKATNQVLVQQTNNLSQKIIGQSPAMHTIQSMIERAAPTDANILILGENGTGKELAAREVHRLSLRAEQVFLSVDLGSISESLFESELFGHKKGAFTGAQQDRVGKIKAADGGTLFLDELGNLPLHLQAKLLTVLETRRVTPVGSNKEESFDVRIISATNLKKSMLYDEQKFRQDLLFRLNTVELGIPPLRERDHDIIDIASHYLQLYSKKYQKPLMELSTDAITALSHYHWPGNIRALRHAMERAVIMSDNAQLTASDFQLTEKAKHHKSKLALPENISEEAEDMNEEFNLENLEKQAIGKVLKKHRYNISHSAKELGLTRAALYRRMEKHGF